MQSINFFTSIPFHGVLFIDSKFAEGRSLAKKQSFFFPSLSFVHSIAVFVSLKSEAQRYLLNEHGRVTEHVSSIDPMKWQSELSGENIFRIILCLFILTLQFLLFNSHLKHTHWISRCYEQKLLCFMFSCR